MSAAPDIIKTPGGLSSRELAQFDAIARLAYSEAGLVLPRDKAPMVLARVAKRVRAGHHADLSAYCAFIDGEGGEQERHELVNTLTTNVTSFFRERHHFEALRDTILPELADRAAAGGRIRIWSAGCSSGQEPYSLAMTVLEALPNAAALDVRILATDIDTHILAAAREGLYSAAQVEPIPAAAQQRFFEMTPAETGASRYRIADEARRLVRFRELNLLADWPMSGRFDVIFCRNVVIYFDRQTQTRLWSRFAQALSPDGHLFVGHSERIETTGTDTFRAVGTTMYQLARPAGHERKGV